MFWVSKFEAEEVLKGLDGVESAVHKVANKNVSGIGHLPADAEKLEEVKKLAVDVATHGDRRLNRLHV